jgi:hypothetical protein
VRLIVALGIAFDFLGLSCLYILIKDNKM